MYVVRLTVYLFEINRKDTYLLWSIWFFIYVIQAAFIEHEYERHDNIIPIEQCNSSK